MDIQTAKKVLESAMWTDDSVMLEGPHGIGKSAIVCQFAEENDMHVEVLFLSTQEVGDIIGIPHTSEVHGQTVTVWSVPIWLQRMQRAAKQGKRCVLFLDELNRAALDVRQSALPLALDGRIHEHELPKVNGFRTMVIAAINPPGVYQVDELDPALMDRFLLLNVEADVGAWLSWARNAGVPDVVRDFIADHPDRIHYTPTEGIGATPRSWSKLGAYVANATSTPDDIMYYIIKGKVGSELGSQFYSYYKQYSKIVQVEDIERIVDQDIGLDDAVEQIKNLMSNAEAIQRTELAHKLRNKYKDADQMMPYVVYLYSLEIELVTAFLKNLRSEAPEEYSRLAVFDGHFNGKELFRRIVVAAHAK